jgi:hypothetical protein
MGSLAFTTGPRTGVLTRRARGPPPRCHRPAAATPDAAAAQGGEEAGKPGSLGHTGIQWPAPSPLSESTTASPWWASYPRLHTRHRGISPWWPPLAGREGVRVHLVRGGATAVVVIDGAGAGP